MVFTESMIEQATKERQERELINRLIKCKESYSSGVPNGIELGECQDPSLRPCSSCPVQKAYDDVFCGYLESGLSKSEARWATHQFFGIRTAMLCNGHIAEAERVFFPERYKQALARQEEIVSGRTKEKVSKTKDIVRRNEQNQQLSIFDIIGEET